MIIYVIYNEIEKLLRRRTPWQKKQESAAPNRFYGDGGTIHSTCTLDVETHNGTVVSVWFRCQQLPFNQCEVGVMRASEMLGMLPHLPELHGVEVRDEL